MSPFTSDDLTQLERSGIGREEAQRQIALLSSPPPPPELVRPVTPGDGLRRLEPAGDDAGEADDLPRYEEARRAGRFAKMVPASGAASRMFKSLAVWTDWAGLPGAAAKEMNKRVIAGDLDAADLLRFVTQLPELPFVDRLAETLESRGQDLETLRRQGDGAALARLLLHDMGYLDRPKALIPFHRRAAGDGADGAEPEVRTAFDEQLVEAAAHLADADGVCRLHFTVQPDAREDFEAHLARARERFEERLGVRFEVTFSTQSPATDTLAATPEGEPFRLDDGHLLLRPGGHGALITNLATLAREGADLVFLKNIDNVQPDSSRAETVRWKRLLADHLLRLRERSLELLDALETADEGTIDGAIEDAERFLATELTVETPPAWAELDTAEHRRRLVDRLDRPLRVAGMVPNTGEPGGGPFWVRGRDGTVTGQIVEKAQIDRDDPEQERILAASTHFNPVDLVVCLRDRHGEAHDLERFVDREAVFVAPKSHQGRPLQALERPGLWNGAMAGWNTAFVEVPLATFTPVKTVFDLLRKTHRWR